MPKTYQIVSFVFVLTSSVIFYNYLAHDASASKKPTILGVFFLDNKEQGLALLIYKQKRVSFVLLAANFICKVEN